MIRLPSEIGSYFAPNVFFSLLFFAIYCAFMWYNVCAYRVCICRYRVYVCA